MPLLLDPPLAAVLVFFDTTPAGVPTLVVCPPAAGTAQLPPLTPAFMDSAMASSYLTRNSKIRVWSASDAPEPPMSWKRLCNSVKIGVLKRPGLARGRCSSAGSHRLASPIHSYCVRASVEAQEPPSATTGSS